MSHPAQAPPEGSLIRERPILTHQPKRPLEALVPLHVAPRIASVKVSFDFLDRKNEVTSRKTFSMPPCFWSNRLYTSAICSKRKRCETTSRNVSCPKAHEHTQRVERSVLDMLQAGVGVSMARILGAADQTDPSGQPDAIWSEVFRTLSPSFHLRAVSSATKALLTTCLSHLG